MRSIGIAFTVSTVFHFTNIFISIIATSNMFLLVGASYPSLKFVKYCTEYTIDVNPSVELNIGNYNECFAMCVRQRSTCVYVQLKFRTFDVSDPLAPPGNAIPPSEQWNCKLFADKVQNVANSLISSEGSVLYEVVQPAEGVEQLKTVEITTTAAITTTTTTTTTKKSVRGPGNRDDDDDDDDDD